MKSHLLKFIIFLSVGLFGSITVKANSITNELPFYFAIPESAWSTLSNNANLKKIAIADFPYADAGLRAFVVDDNYALTNGKVKETSKNILEKKAKHRAEVTRRLQKQGLLKSGDIILSFRPDWRNTSPYPHVQMGVSHAGMIYERNGKVFNLDMPLDSEYNGRFLNSELNAPHYLELDTYHIVRPRNLDRTDTTQLNAWVETLRNNYSSIRNQGLLRFNSNYSEPKYGNYGSSPASFINTLAQILNGNNTYSKDLKMYCSEFVWALHALANCPVNSIDNKNTNALNCAQPNFSPLPMLSPNASGRQNNLSGLADGPLRILASMNITPKEKVSLINDMFDTMKASALSSGHKKVADSPQIKQLMGYLQQYYTAIIYTGTEQQYATRGATLEQAVAGMNSALPANYSPVGFLINSFLPESNDKRAYDYVATVIFE